MHTYIIIFSLGLIELCRRLGHEAFGEEDDEACDLGSNNIVLFVLDKLML